MKERRKRISTDRFTEILNYLSAMSRDMGEFRQEVKARLDGLETRLDGLETRLNGVETRLDGLEARIGNIEKRLDHFEMVVRSRFDDLSSDIRRLSHKVDNVQEDVEELRIAQRDQKARIETLEGKQA